MSELPIYLGRAGEYRRRHRPPRHQLHQNTGLFIFFYRSKDDDLLAHFLLIVSFKITFEYTFVMVVAQSTPFQDLNIATNYGVTHFPALIYFENQVPSIYEGTNNNTDLFIQHR